MKLIKEVTTNPKANKRYLLLDEVTDMEEIILQLCNMERIPEFDETPDDGVHNYEAWTSIGRN
jgi:hypothetical protein